MQMGGEFVISSQIKNMPLNLLKITVTSKLRHPPRTFALELVHIMEELLK
jgi:hypothetical protein